MKKVIASLVAVAGLSAAASAQVNTTIQWQASTNPSSGFTNNLTVSPGTTVYARALVTYTGSSPVQALASFVFQPTISNWEATDTLLPFINGGVGSNTSTPPGVISGAQITDTTSFGRLSPWGRSATSSTSFLRGFVHVNPDGSGQTYLRIAQAQVTSWIGGTGNTSGGSGVPISQLSNVGRVGTDPALNTQTTNIYVFKMGFTLTNDTVVRNLVIDSPLAGFGNFNSTNQQREVYWYGDVNSEATGQTRGTATVNTATIHVIPTPASLALLGLGGLAVGRRRR